jgi:hypothetical protein
LQPPFYRSRYFWGVQDAKAFNENIDGLMSAARLKAGWFAADNVIAYGRNLGFLDDAPFRKAWETHAETMIERGIIWRTHVVVWAARNALRLGGDYIECGCYKGTTARIVADVVDLSERSFYLYDLFEHNPSMAHHAMPEHSPELFDFVQARFPEPNIHVIRGFVPESFAQGVPDRIAFAHIDMNNAPAEIAALEAIEHRLVPGAMIVLDDFGAIPYRAQHVAETAWFAERGRFVLELPTSQGLVVW